MARGDYGPEIKGAMNSSPPGKPRAAAPKESPADMARDVGAGIKEGSPRDQRLDAMPKNRVPPRAGGPTPGGPQNVVRGPATATATSGMPPDLPHVAAATSIAHAILNRAGGGGMR